MERDPDTVTRALEDVGDQSPASIAAKLLPIVYDELRDLARRYLRSERANHTLQPTALLHEAFMRLVDQSRVDWKGRTHFYAVSAEAMHRVLIDHARAKGRAKRGGGWQRVLLDDMVAPEGLGEVDVIALHDALDKLEKLDEEQARVVRLRFFGGLTVEEVAHHMGVSKRKVEGNWTHAKAWLREELRSEQVDDT
jgi:RNA polymerase sigma factor (TIGR02999 family)